MGILSAALNRFEQFLDSQFLLFRCPQSQTEGDVLASIDVSGCRPLARGPSQGCQLYAMSGGARSERDTIGRPLVHRAAFKQCTGEALYLDDIPLSQGELFLGLVTSKRAHARLLSVDLSPARGMPGVIEVIDYSDVPQLNEWETLELVFASDKVSHEGQVIAAVVAETHAQAQRAAHSVKVTYEDLEPVVTIKDAIARNSLYPFDIKVDTGDVRSALAQCEYTVSGEMSVSAQEHLYLEPHGCVVYPRDGEELEKALMRVLGLPANKIVVKVKRLGGGFGGKETRNVTVLLPAAVAAMKTNRPVRAVLDRDEDMRMTGTRHPAYVTYKIGFDSEGKILALDADLYLNMGHSVDLSPAVLETALLGIDSSYNIKNFRVRGHLCLTNLTSCTAFRGFGGPQAIIMAENWVTHVAEHLGLSQEAVRERNFYKDGDTIPCGQMLKSCNVTRCWEECIRKSQFDSRLETVNQFNR
ncbi:xanthine dehydrogenase/oxidase [Elysia marginata]|uniref:Xanthine dehydrogenase/oxidase n=1 Tax=Elysia marginata TaxID=1093978 RepID=A0AAV4I655_9GAST|nr:xanthine dehydrogenase/oxidase [Elysia marginata]